MTLIELLVVMSILGLLSVTVLPAFSNGESARAGRRAAAAVSSLAGQPGFSAAESAAHVAAGCDALILMLPDSTIVDGLLWTQKLSDSLKPGQILIDMGSSDPVCSRENAARLSALGIGFVDAPVSGGVRRAVDASLAIMIGGEADSVARVRPALEAMGKTLVHVGTAGAGHAVKALNN
jgi:3-hydroxyisobutyrate dehydrogenase